MKLFSTAFLILLVTLLSPAEEFDLYLLAGQSNMDGRGQAADLKKDQQQVSKQHLIFYRNPPHTSDGWKALGPGYSIPPKYKGKLPSPTFGPELGFVSAMQKAQHNRKFALIKGSKGGTSLRKDWHPGEKGKPESQGPCYRNFIETIVMANKALKEAGHTASLRGLLWHQGESDSKSSTKKHRERLVQLMTRIREDTGMPQLSIVLGEVYDNGNRDSVRTALLEASKTDPACGFVSSAGLKTWDPGTHFDAASQWILGERFATAMLLQQGRSITAPE